MAAGSLLDDAMAKFGGESWSLSTLDSLACSSISEQEMEDPITISAFIAAVGRRQQGLSIHRRSCFALSFLSCTGLLFLYWSYTSGTTRTADKHQGPCQKGLGGG